MRITEENKKWVSIWGNAMSITDRTAATYGKDITFRYPVFVPFDGTAVRFTFDNFCGTEDAELTCAYAAIAVGDESACEFVSYPIMFNGAKNVTLPAGKFVKSDPVSIPLHKGQKLFVSFYFGNFVELRSGVVTTGPLSRGNYAFGYHVTDEQLPMDYTRNTNIYYFLSDVSVYTSEKNKAVICYGDSITAQAWPDYLALEFVDNAIERSVVRKAASGTRVLRQYSCATYRSYGLKGTIRFPHEIPMADGADTVIIQQGINDIIHPVGETENPFRPWSDLPTAEELFAGLEYYVRQAREAGLRVYLGTLLPIEGWRTYAPFRDEIRSAVNDFIRNTPLADGVIDFDKAVRDPLHPARFGKGYDSGDHLHPSEDAYRVMAKEAAWVLNRAVRLPKE